MATANCHLKKRFRAGAVLLAATALSACAVGNSILEDTTRSTAKTVINSVVESRLPGVNAAPYTDCIIDNATGEEVIDLAQTALTQNTNAAADQVFKIAKRPDTSNCIAQSALGSLLG